MKTALTLLASILLFTPTLPAHAVDSSSSSTPSVNSPDTSNTTAKSGIVTARDPQTILSALQREGYVGTLSKLDNGRSSISVKISGVTSYIDFYDCADDHTNCATLLFNVALDLKGGASLAQENDWNSDQVTGRVWIDKSGNPALDYSVSTFDGVSEDTFDQILKLWDTKIGDFKSFFHF